MINRLIRCVLWFIALLFLCFSAALALIRYYTADLNQYQDTIISTITQWTKAPLQFEQINMRWHGFSPSVSIDQLALVVVPGPEITITAKKANLRINIFRSLMKQTPVFHSLSVQDVTLDIRHDKPSTRDPRIILQNVLAFLPQLNSAGLENVHLRIFFNKAATVPNVEFRELSAYFYDRKFRGYQLDFVERKNNRISKMIWAWKKEGNADIFLDLNDYSSPFTLPVPVLLNGKVWGKWYQQDLARLYGTVTAQLPMMEPVDVTLDFFNPEGYQINLNTDFAAIKGRIARGRFGIAIDYFDLNKFKAYYHNLPAIFETFNMKDSWFSGDFQTGIDSINLRVDELGLKISQNDALPHIDRLGFVINGNATQGHINFTRGLRLRHGFFKEDLADIILKQETRYHFENKRLTLFPDMLINHDAVDATVRGQFSIAFREGYKPVVFSNLSGEIKPLPLEQVLRYLPRVHIPERVNQWLDEALKDAGNTRGNAHWALWGDMRHSPWDKDSDPEISHFRAEFDTERASLDVMPAALVPFRNVEAHVLIENNFLGIKGKRATLLDHIQLEDIIVNIDHFHSAFLDISGTLKGKFAKAQQYFAQSSFLKSIDDVTRSFKGDSLLSGNLAMKIPLAEKSVALAINGSVEINKGQIVYKNANIPMKNVSGWINFDEKGIVSSKKLSAQVNNQTVRANIHRNSEALMITMTGDQNPNLWLKAYAGFLSPFFQMQGLAKTESVLTIPLKNPDLWQLSISSDLSKVDLDAPFGLDKAENVKSQLKLDLVSRSAQRLDVHISLADLLSVQLINLVQASWDHLKINLDTTEIKGIVEAHSAKKFKIDLDYLVIPYNSRVSKNSVNTLANSVFVTPFNQLSYKELPEADLQIHSVYRGNEYLGKLVAQSRFSGQHWRIQPVELMSPKYQIKGSVEWYPSAAIKTRILADFDMKDKQAMNHLLGMDLGLTGLMHGEVEVQSVDELDKITLNSINLKSKVYIEKGNMRSVSIGPLKALGAMNLSTLKRRLKFDFSDLSAEGLSFDAAEGLIDLINNKLYLNNVLVDAPSLNAKLDGYVDLASRVYDINIKAFPKASFLAPVAGTLIGGPIIGAGVLVFERIFNDEINRIPRTEFQWKGLF